MHPKQNTAVVIVILNTRLSVNTYTGYQYVTSTYINTYILFEYLKPKFNCIYIY